MLSAAFLDINEFPDELLVTLFQCIQSPSTYYKFSLLNRRFARISTDKKVNTYLRKKYLQRVWVTPTHCYHILPNGDREGDENEWHENNNLKLHCSWANNFKSGRERRWNSHGKLVSERNWENSQLSGRAREWRSNKTLHTECYYKNGQLHGQEKKFDSSGNSCKFFTLYLDMVNLKDHRILTNRKTSKTKKLCSW